MNWMQLSWVVMAASCLTLASIHLLIWNQQRANPAHLSFSLAGFSIAAGGIFEVLLMQAASPAEFGMLVRWMHVPLALLIVALVGFVRLHLGAGRPWLGHLAWALRAIALIPNFTTGVNENWLEITSLVEREAWGGAVYVTPVGTPSGWIALTQLSNYLLVAFFLDAAFTTWRGPPGPLRSKTVGICVSMAVFVVLAGFWNVAIMLGKLQMPVAVLPAFMGVLLVMSHDLGSSVLRAKQLSSDLSSSRQTLSRSEQRIDDAVLAAGFGLWDWDVTNKEFWLSPRARELLGISPDQVFDRDVLYSCADPEDRGGVEVGVASALRNGGPYVSEFRVVHADGRRLWLRARGHGDLTEAGRPARFRGVLLDITERKQAAVQRDELAHLSRVALLAELSGSLAHELNQPLTSILSNAQAALRFIAHDPPNLAEVSESLSNIVESDKRAGEVIRRLRAMLRKDPPDFRRLDMNDVVRDVLRIVRSDLLNKNVDIALDLQPDLPPAEGDRVQLQQVLLNLIVNGSDAMQMQDAHDRRLTISTRGTTAIGVELHVSDCGHGIPHDDLDRIFSPFVTSKSDGMGLGLAVCKTIIESHGGHLWATNNEVAGASVHFRLPALGSPMDEQDSGRFSDARASFYT